MSMTRTVVLSLLTIGGAACTSLPLQNRASELSTKATVSAPRLGVFRSDAAPTFKLNVNFNPQDLSLINSAVELVTIVKQTDGPSVVWIAFSPFENNSVVWTEAYSWYAATAKPSVGAVITPNSKTQASPQMSYTFAGGVFDAGTPDPILPKGTYKVTNNESTTPSMTFGLAQAATVNGGASVTNPVNTELVPAQQAETAVPQETILVFLRSGATPGLVLSASSASSASGASKLVVESAPIYLTFTSSITELTIQYDAASAQFNQ